jgi:hypothetical protein
MKCPVHGTEMKEIVAGTYTQHHKREDHIGWFCDICKKQYSDSLEVIGIVI